MGIIIIFVQHRIKLEVFESLVDEASFENIVHSCFYSIVIELFEIISLFVTSK
jgi:hypothetical protein